MPVGINSNSNRSIVKNITVGIPEKRVTGGFDINTIAGVNTDAKTHGDLLVYDSNTSKYVTATIVTGDGITFTWQDSDSSGNATFLLTLDSSEIDRDVRALISVSDAGGDGSLAYNSTTGVITYTGPSASEVRAHLSAGTNLSFSSGAFSLDSSQHVKVSKITTSSDIVAGGNVEIGANSFVGTEIEVKKIAAKDSDDIYSSANIHVNGQIQADSATFNRLRTRVYSFPTADGTQSGQAIVTDGSGNLSFAFAGSEGIVVSAMKDLADVDNDLQTKRHPDHFLLWDSSYTTHVGTGQYVSTVFGTEVHSRFASSTDLTFDSSTGRFTITNTGVDSGVYGSSSLIPIITVSPQGQIDSIGTATAYTTSSFNTDLASKNTDNLSEGSTNLYFTNTRADARVTALVDSAYVQLRQSASGGGGVDSSAVSGIITADVNASFINALTIGADSFGGQAPSFYRNAGNLNAGTVDSARLPVIASANTADSASNAALAVRAGIATTTTGNAATATALETARNIGGVSFDGTGNINLPGVNTAGNQNTSGSAATLTTARTIGGVSFDGSANINLPGVNTAGNQNTSGNAATADSASRAALAVRAGISTTADSASNAALAVRAGIATTAAAADSAANAALAVRAGIATTAATADSAANAALAVRAGGVTPNSVALSTDTTGNYVAAGATSGSGISGSVSSEGGTFTVTSNATNNNTNSTLVFRDGSGNFAAGTITAALSGNASTADSATTAKDAVNALQLANQAASHYLDYANFSNTPTIPTLYGSFVDSTEARKAVSATDAGGDGSFAYNNSTGVFTYTGPSASEARAHFSAGTGVTLSSGEISIGQAVGTSDNVTFGNVVTSNLTVNGTTTSVNSITYTVNDPLIHLADSNETSDALDIGFLGHYFRDGQRRHTGLFRDASNQEYYLYHNLVDSAFDSSVPPNVINRGGTDFTQAMLNANITGAVTGNASTATALATGRNFSITGDVTAGAVSFDGSGNVALTAAIASDVIVNADIKSDAAIADTKLATISTSGKVANSATTATNANTNSAIVARDGSGNFSAGTITAALSGNASTADSAAAAALAVRAGIATTAAAADSAAAAALAVRAGIATLAAEATALETARTIGGVSFDGTANINLPGVNTAGNQNTSGSAATLTTARTIGGVSFDGSGNINLPGVNQAGNQNTSGNAATADSATNAALAVRAGIATTAASADSAAAAALAVRAGIATLAAQATALETARNIGGVSFDGTGNINLPGVNTAGNQNTSGTAAIATTVTVTDNESTNEDNVILFGAGAAGSGNIGVEADGTMTYNPSTGKITATGFIGALTGDASGNAATATALETARNIGGVSFDGTANINLPGVNTSGNQNTSGTAAIATAVTVADESTDTTCFPLFATAASGDLEPKSGSNLTFNSSNGTLGATVFSGSGASLTSITSSNFTSAVTLLIKNSAGSTLKTIVGSAT